MKAIQRELNLRGYAGKPRPEPSVFTRAAIIAYEFDENMPLTGEPSEALLKSLILAGRRADQGRTGGTLRRATRADRAGAGKSGPAGLRAGAH